jgi:hypothetical protein
MTTGRPEQPREAAQPQATPQSHPTAQPHATAGPRTTAQPQAGIAPTRAVLAVALLAAGVVTWAALPMAGAHSGARAALIAAGCLAGLSLAQLTDHIAASRPGRPPRRETAFVPPIVRLWRRAETIGRITPWPEGMIVAVLALEALHRSRPWHTAVLGVVLLAWLLATHLAETAAQPAALRPHLPLIAAGLGLTALSVGAAALPSTGLGATATWLAVLAALATVIVAALALPV